jgi:hypothetical protein
MKKAGSHYITDDEVNRDVAHEGMTARGLTLYLACDLPGILPLWPSLLVYLA